MPAAEAWRKIEHKLGELKRCEPGRAAFFPASVRASVRACTRLPPQPEHGHWSRSQPHRRGSRGGAEVANHFHLLPGLLRAGDHIATSSQRLMNALEAGAALHATAPPLAMVPVSISPYWHQRTEVDRKLNWCRRVFAASVRGKRDAWDERLLAG